MTDAPARHNASCGFTLPHPTHGYFTVGGNKNFCPGVRSEGASLVCNCPRHQDANAPCSCMCDHPQTMTLEEWQAKREKEENRREDSNDSELAQELRTWWYDLAHEEVQRVVPKAVEYGADDLLIIGREMAYLLGRDVDDEEATELGIYFYLLGKQARWRSAIREKRRVSDDTLHDLGVYVRMAQRTRHAGGWPTGPKGETHGDEK